MATKIKVNQSEDLDNVQGRDLFQTPNYAVDLLAPFIPKDSFIWECASGQGKIVKRLQHFGFEVIGTDLLGEPSVNFLKNTLGAFSFTSIITNPPFSLKRKFYLKCLEYNVPFALLIPADYSGWVIDAIRNDGAEKIIPTRRIDFITPNTLQRIHEGEVWELVKDGLNEKTLKEFLKKNNRYDWDRLLNLHPNHHKYNSIYDVPQVLLKKYSSSNFHSYWLTHGFNLGKTETFVELTNKMKENI